MTHVEEVHVEGDLTICEPPQVTGSETAAEVLYPFFEDHLDMYEAMRLMLLDNSKRAKGVVTIGQGGIARMVADHRLIFAAALKTLTPSIILAHNHPSGLTKPSREDIAWTQRAVEIGKVHDITVEDHIILGQRGYFSFRDHRLI